MKLPWTNRRRAEDARLDLERRANQLEYALRAKQPNPAPDADPDDVIGILEPGGWSEPVLELYGDQKARLKSAIFGPQAEPNPLFIPYAGFNYLGRRDAQKVEGYVAHRSGIALDPSHPYYNAPPMLTRWKRIVSCIRQLWTGVTPPREEGVTIYWTPPRGSLTERVAAWFRFRWIKLTRKWSKPKPMAGNVELQSDSYTAPGKQALEQNFSETRRGVKWGDQ